MTELQWKAVKALAALVKAIIQGEKFDSIESQVQYSEELILLDELLKLAA